MYVKIQTCPTASRHLAAHLPGCAAHYVLRGPAGDCVVTLWRTRHEAEHGCPDAGSEHPQRRGDLVYEVIADGAGQRANQVPRTAAVLWFDGPIQDDRLSLLKHVYGQRIPPALAGTPDLMRCIIGWNAATRATVEVLLAASAEAIDRAGASVNAPLPTDDPAAAHGPDTLEPYIVVAHAVEVLTPDS